MTPDAFWQFSLMLYSKKDVATHCLHLQDTYGCNVNLLLFCCWLSHQKAYLDKQTLAEIRNAIDEIEQTLIAHRLRRRQAKGQAHYEALKTEELALEKQQQTQIVHRYLALSGESKQTSQPIDSFCEHYHLTTDTQHAYIAPLLLQLK